MDASAANAAQVLAQINQSLRALLVNSIGSFTLDAASSKVVSDGAVASGSLVVLVPANAAAAALQSGPKHLYVTPGNGSFTVATGDGTAAAGSESFRYGVFTARL